MKLEELQKNWDEFGKADPLWAILTKPGTEGGRWDLDEFFATGRHEIRNVLDSVQAHNGSVPNGRALDFGCGVGRLSQALCLHFDEVTGVDIAPAMLEQANKFNRFPGKCTYVLNEREDLQMFEDRTFSFVYTSLVLQHMNPSYSKRYLTELMRVLQPAGILVFQVTERPSRSPAVAPLPNADYQAKIEILTQPGTAQPGAKIPVQVSVANTGSILWPGFEAEGAWIRLGNHWLSAEGVTLRNDDARAALPRDMRPGERANLEIVVTAPDKPGSYILEFDLVHEGVCWFGHRGSKTAQRKITVLGTKDTASLPAKNKSDTFRPVMEMYGIPKKEVVDLIRKSNGEVLDIEQNVAAGSEWISYRYCVRRSSRS